MAVILSSLLCDGLKGRHATMKSDWIEMVLKQG